MQYGTCNSRFFETFSRPEKIKVYHGGGGSGKSMSIGQHMVLGLCSGDGMRRAVFRKTFASIKATTYLVLKDILNDWGVPYKNNKTDHYFIVFSKNGKLFDYNGKEEDWNGTINTLSYLGLDDPEKIKGAEFIEVWLEEVTDFNEDDYKQLRIRLSRTRDDVIMYMSLNPIESHHWVIKKVIDKAPTDPHIFAHHSTYHDNEINLSKTFIDELENLINIDENFYRVYTLGLPGVLKGQIYSGWDFSDPSEWSSGYKSGMHMYGIDFGFNAPMAMSEVWFYDGEYYIKEVLYERGLTTTDLLDRMESLGVSKTDDIYCDSAEPDRIQELCNRGYNAKPSRKDVKAGIDSVKGSLIHVDATCSPNIYKEYNNYKWKENKAGDSLDEPVKAFDHQLDNVRYQIFTAPTEPIQAVSKVQIERPSFSGFASSRPHF